MSRSFIGAVDGASEAPWLLAGTTPPGPGEARPVG